MGSYYDGPAPYHLCHKPAHGQRKGLLLAIWSRCRLFYVQHILDRTVGAVICHLYESHASFWTVQHASYPMLCLLSDHNTLWICDEAAKTGYAGKEDRQEKVVILDKGAKSRQRDIAL
jgi:hypothetical protein